MTKRRLFDIILKILGIYLIKGILLMLPQVLSIIILITNHQEREDTMMTLAFSFLLLLIYVFVAYCLIFKSDLIIDKLKLDKGIDQEPIALNIHRSTVLSISIIVIGGLILSEEIPNFCRQLFTYFEERKFFRGQPNPSTSYVILAGAKIIIGLLLITGQRQIVDLIELRRKK